MTFHLTAPDPEFLDKLALPFAVAVPATTPLHDMGNTPVPGTGLYMWKSYQPSTAAVMVRNPYFHVWSKDAQPAGNPNEIEFKFGLNFPGYKPYCPFTLHAGASGRWSAPDLAKARQLVKQSGTRGAHVAVVGTTDTVGKAITLQFVQDLNRIGYVATPKLLSNAIQNPYIQDSRNHVQVAYSQWFQDYPAASDFLNVLLGCGYFHPGSDASPNISGFCDRSVQAQMNHALRLGETNPAAANLVWSQVDRRATDLSPIITLFNPKLVDFVSERLHGYQYNPQAGFLWDEAWIR